MGSWGNGKEVIGPIRLIRPISQVNPTTQPPSTITHQPYAVGAIRRRRHTPQAPYAVGAIRRSRHTPQAPYGEAAIRHRRHTTKSAYSAGAIALLLNRHILHRC